MRYINGKLYIEFTDIFKIAYEKSTTIQSSAFANFGSSNRRQTIRGNLKV